MSGVEITRTEYAAGELRALSARCADGAQVRRILAIAMGLEGRSRTEAAQLNGMDRRTRRDGAHQYNRHGPSGLISRFGSGRPPSIAPLQKAELLEIALAGPGPEIHGAARWRGVDLKAAARRRFGVEVSEISIGRWLRELRLTRLQPRPAHPDKDPEAEAAFKKTSPIWSKAPSPRPRMAIR